MRNYAQLNKRGFMSTKSIRSKKRCHIEQSKGNSAPSSPTKTKTVLRKQTAKKRLKLDTVVGNVIDSNKDKEKSANFNEHVEGSVNAQLSEWSSIGVNANELMSALENMNKDTSNCNISIISEKPEREMDLSTLEGLPLTEKKERLRRMNAQLEAQLAQEEDDEFQQLMERQKELQRKLSASTVKDDGSVRRKKSSKIHVTPPNKSNRYRNFSGVDNELNRNLPVLSEIQDLLHVTDKKNKSKKVKRVKKRRNHKHKVESSSESESSDSSESSSESTDESEWSDDEPRKRKKGKKFQSGLYAKASNVRLRSNELFAHSTLDDELIGDRDLKNLSFNLLVAGELEIISDHSTSEKEKFTRMEVLKKLSYKAEYLSNTDILRLYSKFIQKIEKGKFRWGSRSDLRIFDNQLIYALSIENRKVEKSHERKVKNKMENRKIYCLDYNRGVCKQSSSHEGKLHGNTVFKLHVCKACLVKNGEELQHPEVECNSK